MDRVDNYMRIILGEMAYHRARTIELLTGYERTLNRHLLLYYLIKDTHHLTEIMSYIRELDNLRLKGHKKLRAKDYYTVLFSEPFDPEDYIKIEDMAEDINEKYNLTEDDDNKFRIDAPLYYGLLRSFYLELSELLSRNIRNDRSALKELVVDYFGSNINEENI